MKLETIKKIYNDNKDNILFLVTTGNNRVFLDRVKDFKIDDLMECLVYTDISTDNIYYVDIVDIVIAVIKDPKGNILNLANPQTL